MRPGFALTCHRFATFPPRTAIDVGSRITKPPGRSTIAFAAGIFFVAVFAAQAQESIEPDVLPGLAEPPPTTTTPEALPSASTDPFASSPQTSLSAAAQPVPSSTNEMAPLPSSEDAFPSSPEPLSSSMNYSTAQTSLVPAPVAIGPPGAFDAKNVFAGNEISLGEPRRFHYRFQLTVRGVWDDNINISHNNRKSDYYFAIEPQLTVGFGDIEGRGRAYLRLDYMPSIILFVDHSNEDDVNHLIRLEGGYNFGRLTLTAIQEIAILNGANLNSIFDTTGLFANVDVSTPTEVNIFNSRLRANYDLTGKLYLQGEFDASIFDYPDFISSATISGGLYLYYRWLPKLSVGVGGTFGHEFVDDPSNDQNFEQVNARVLYEATGKLNLYASAGAEFRQFEGHRDTRVSPVFEVGAIYHPFENTTLTLAAGRRMYDSGFFVDQDFAATYVVGRFQQRLFQRVYFGLAGGYENSDYFSTDRSVSATRDDDYWFIEPSVDVLITRWLSTGVYYLHRDNSSNIDFFSFYDNQVGVRATLRF
jgi:hypothetical protein